MRASLALAVILASGAVPLQGQIRASERARVAQTVDGTTITVEYARPRVRGRSPIFGGQVHWGEVWTPGANMATTLETDRDVAIDGRAVRKGKYSVWLVVAQEGPWTLVLDSVASLYHTSPPGERAGQIRLPVAAAAGPPTEVLTWSFPEVTATGTVLTMQWADRSVRLPIAITPRHPITIGRDAAEPYLGTWAIRRVRGDGAVDMQRPPGRFEVVHHDGSLMADWSPAPWPGAERVYLIRIAPDWFMMGTMENGALYDVVSEWVFEFGRGSDGAQTLEIRGEGDRALARGARAP
jgi:hypothetical protein